MSLSKKTWDGDYWGPEGALALARRKFEASETTSEDRISYASTLYSAATRSAREAKRSFMQARFVAAWVWYWRFGGYAASAIGQLHTAWERSWERTGSTNFSLCQIETSLAIWIGLGRFQTYWPGGQDEKTMRQILQHGLYLLDKGLEECSVHTQAFLTSHAITLGIYLREPDVINQLQVLAEASEKAGENNQAGRIWKAVHAHWKKLGDKQMAERALENAMRLAGPDQRYKIGG